MNIIWSIVSVFGFVSMLLLVVGIWTHLDMKKEQREAGLHPDTERDERPYP
jgi:hypothetical protein